MQNRWAGEHQRGMRMDEEEKQELSDFQLHSAPPPAPHPHPKKDDQPLLQTTEKYRRNWKGCLKISKKYRTI